MNVDIKEVKIEIYVLEEYIEPIRDSLTHLGACKIGNYDNVVSYHSAKGFWRPLSDSNPFSGEKGKICCGTEMKMEVRCPIEILQSAMQEIRRIHPYEEPVINIIPLLSIPT